MMRAYCDSCDSEIVGPLRRIRRERYIAPGQVIDVEVITAWNKAWNGGHLCPTCILDAVANGKDVPR